MDQEKGRQGEVVGGEEDGAWERERGGRGGRGEETKAETDHKTSHNHSHFSKRRQFVGSAPAIEWRAGRAHLRFIPLPVMQD